jgi:hypothetical protein
VSKAARVLVPALVVLTAAVFAGQVKAAAKMPIGFYDDISFRWSPDRITNLDRAAAAGASVIHTTANWPVMAPTKPANAADGADPAYHLNDLDELVSNATIRGFRVMIDIYGTPKWANGNLPPNRLPKSMSTLTTFAQMLATRYNGHNGHGSVSLYSVWNEPNLGQFLMPQFVGKKIVGPANYGKLYKAAYSGIKAGNPLAKVAIGETSARGRDKPLGGTSATIAPATFARLLAQTKGLKFDGWAHHPYPTSPNLPPTQKVRYPNVTLSTLPQFEKDLAKWYHRAVPIWITEYGHETKPGEPHGVTNSVQAKYARQALQIATKDPLVQMFIWFTFRDAPGNAWQSGLEGLTGTAKPSYATFKATATPVDGVTQSVKAGTSPTLKLYFPLLYAVQGTGGQIGMTYHVSDDSTGKTVASGQPVLPLAADMSVSIALDFKPVKGHSYSFSTNANEANGHSELQTAKIVAT